MRLLKSSLLVAFFGIIALQLNAFSIDTEPKLIFNHSSFEYRTVDNAGLSLFKNIVYNDAIDHLEIQTREEIRYIQLFDENGLLTFQMPISGNRIHLSINDYEKGDYTLNLKTAKNSSFVETKLTIK